MTPTLSACPAKDGRVCLGELVGYCDCAADSIPATDDTTTIINEVIKAVAIVWEVTEAHIISNRRTVAVTEPRFAAMYLIRQALPKLALKTVAERLGLTDHSTVIHGKARCVELMDVYPKYAYKVTQASDLLCESIGHLIEEDGEDE